MLKELFRTEPPKTMRERLKGKTVENFERAFARLGLPDFSFSILTLDERKVRLDTMLKCLSILADRICDLEAEVRDLKARVSELEKLQPAVVQLQRATIDANHERIMEAMGKNMPPDGTPQF